MAKKFFTADWHAGEVLENIPSLRATHSYLRPARTDTLIEQWIQECWGKLTSEDTLFFLGDMALRLEDWQVYKALPPCKKILIMGDKEYKSKFFSQEEFLEEIGKLDLFEKISISDSVEVNGRHWTMGHVPTSLFANQTPILCGHVHDIWRSQMTPQGFPIINVGIDAWHCLVSEEFIQHQYDALTKGYYDGEARVDLWKTKE
ncbi:MAG: hypothetical protein LBO09_06120 [Candidatus Peribacteria bacterium]|jgi:calcineurin-like phosphoesterase family protein|nr:hypothetical protein [Candidatus Peribacteria bacterium]